MLYIINSADYDGHHIDITSVLLESDETPEGEFDIDVAISKAINEYVRTDKGFHILAENGGTLNLDIFNDCVPNEICEKYGFRKIQNVSTSSFTKDADTAFNKKPEFIVTDIQWVIPWLRGIERIEIRDVDSEAVAGLYKRIGIDFFTVQADAVRFRFQP